jgi:hypothetical protein
MAAVVVGCDFSPLSADQWSLTNPVTATASFEKALICFKRIQLTAAGGSLSITTNQGLYFEITLGETFR